MNSFRRAVPILGGHKFWAILGYKVSSRLLWAARQNLVSKVKSKNRCILSTVVRLSSMVGLEFSYYFSKIKKAIEVEKQKFRHTLRETGERRRRRAVGGGIL